MILRFNEKGILWACLICELEFDLICEELEIWAGKQCKYASREGREGERRPRWVLPAFSCFWKCYALETLGFAGFAGKYFPANWHFGSSQNFSIFIYHMLAQYILNMFVTYFFFRFLCGALMRWFPGWQDRGSRTMVRPSGNVVLMEICCCR